MDPIPTPAPAVTVSSLPFSSLDVFKSAIFSEGSCGIIVIIAFLLLLLLLLVVLLILLLLVLVTMFSSSPPASVVLVVEGDVCDVTEIPESEKDEELADVTSLSSFFSSRDIVLDVSIVDDEMGNVAAVDSAVVLLEVDVILLVLSVD